MEKCEQRQTLLVSGAELTITRFSHTRIKVTTVNPGHIISQQNQHNPTDLTLKFQKDPKPSTDRQQSHAAEFLSMGSAA